MTWRFLLFAEIATRELVAQNFHFGYDGRMKMKRWVSRVVLIPVILGMLVATILPVMSSVTNVSAAALTLGDIGNSAKFKALYGAMRFCVVSTRTPDNLGNDEAVKTVVETGNFPTTSINLQDDFLNVMLGLGNGSHDCKNMGGIINQFLDMGGLNSNDAKKRLFCNDTKPGIFKVIYDGIINQDYDGHDAEHSCSIGFDRGTDGSTGAIKYALSPSTGTTGAERQSYLQAFVTNNFSGENLSWYSPGLMESNYDGAEMYYIDYTMATGYCGKGNSPSSDAALYENAPNYITFYEVGTPYNDNTESNRVVIPKTKMFVAVSNTNNFVVHNVPNNAGNLIGATDCRNYFTSGHRDDVNNSYANAAIDSLVEWYRQDCQKAFTAAGTAFDESTSFASSETSEGRSIQCNLAGYETPATPGVDSNETPGTNSDTCDGGLIGWLMCPMFDNASGVIDTFMGFIDKGLAFNVFGNDKASTAMREIWGSFLTVANIAFAIVFLVIIYSTATSTGLKNYDIKKIMPRIVIAAILVNTSFWICAAISDLVNIIGGNIENFIISASGLNPDTSPGELIINVIRDILVAIAAIAILILFGGFAALLLGLLLIVAMLSLREVAVVALIIISPLAFVAWLLPNTEKWFKKWLTEFTRMLFIYPMIMGVWGLTKVLSYVIHSVSTGGPLELVMQIVIYLAPVAAIIPIFKMGGQLMGKLQGLTQKGIDKAGGQQLKALDKERAAARLAQTRTAAMRNMAFKKDKDGNYVRRGGPIGLAGSLIGGGAMARRKKNQEANLATLRNLRDARSSDTLESDLLKTQMDNSLKVDRKVLESQGKKAEMESAGRLARATTILNEPGLAGYLDLVQGARSEAQADEDKQIKEANARINTVSISTDGGRTARKLNNKEKQRLAIGESLTDILTKDDKGRAYANAAKLVRTDALGNVEYNIKGDPNSGAVTEDSQIVRDHILNKENDSLQMLGALMDGGEWSASEGRALADFSSKAVSPAVRKRIATIVAAGKLPGIAGADVPAIQDGTFDLGEAYVRSLDSQEVKANLLGEKPSYIGKYFAEVADPVNYAGKNEKHKNERGEFVLNDNLTDEARAAIEAKRNAAKQKAVELLNSALNDPNYYGELQKSEKWNAVTGFNPETGSSSGLLGGIGGTPVPPRGSRYEVANDGSIQLVRPSNPSPPSPGGSSGSGPSFNPRAGSAELDELLRNRGNRQ